MKIEYTAVTIASPVNANNVIVKQASIKTDTGFDMAIKLVDDNLNQSPVDSIDEERCSHYGIWEATFWRNGDNEQLLKIVIGGTRLRNPNTLGDDPTYCGLEVYQVEGVTAHDSLRCLLSLTTEKLLMALPFSALGHYVVDEYVELANWMLKNNLTNVNKNEVRATCIVFGCKLERLWGIHRGGELTLKQTLVSFNPLQSYRQTMLIEKSHHINVKAADLPKITARYQAVNAPQTPSITQQHPQWPHNQYMANVIQYLQVNGFNQKTIDALREEAMNKLYLFPQGGYPQNHGQQVMSGFPPMQGFAQNQHQGTPLTGGHQF